jgi:hypothetical protein
MASIKEVTTGPKSRNLSDSIILEFLDWTMNLPDEISHTNCDRRYADCIFQIIYLFTLACASTFSCPRLLKEYWQPRFLSICTLLTGCNAHQAIRTCCKHGCWVHLIISDYIWYIFWFITTCVVTPSMLVSCDEKAIWQFGKDSENLN